MTDFDSTRSYFPQPRVATVTRPPADAPTMTEAIAFILLDADLLFRPETTT